MTNPAVQRGEVVLEAPLTHTVEAKEFVGLFRAVDATPSILGSRKFKAGNVGANNITYFDDGYDGKDIYILGDGFTTVVHDAAKLLTNTAANKLLASNKVYHFTRYDGKWVEDA